MGRRRISKDEYLDTAYKIVNYLRSQGRPIHVDQIVEDIGIKKGRCQGAVKYYRNRFIEKPGSVGQWFITCSNKGWGVAEGDDVLKECFATMYAGAVAKYKTFRPIELYLKKRGVEVDEIKKDVWIRANTGPAHDVTVDSVWGRYEDYERDTYGAYSDYDY